SGCCFRNPARLLQWWPSCPRAPGRRCRRLRADVAGRGPPVSTRRPRLWPVPASPYLPADAIPTRSLCSASGTIPGAVATELASSVMHHETTRSLPLPVLNRLAQRAVQTHPLLFGQRFGSLQNLAGAFIRVSHLALLFVGHRHHPQQQNFIN